MSGINICWIFGAVLALCAVHAAPVAAQTTQNASDSPLYDLSINDDSEDVQGIPMAAELTEGNKRRAKRNLRTLLRRAEREWPRLMLRYAQPAVRGLLADRQTGSNSLALKTTFFHNNAKGLHLAGGLARNSWGEREARLQFSARF